jgi:methionyl-tRNA formyltransferase
MRVGLLSTVNSPALGYIIRDLTQEGISVNAVILDSNAKSEEEKRSHEEKTGGRLPPIPLEEFEALQIPFFFASDHRSDTSIAIVRELSLDLLVNAATPRILNTDILKAPTVGVLAWHTGLLPHFRGATCIEWAIYLDEQVGVSVYFMNEGIDEGPIVSQKALSFTKTDKYQDVRVKVYKAGHRALARGVANIISKKLGPADFAPQTNGRHFEEIEPQKMQEVIRKLSESRYIFQR